jgi:predicted unusual protein kinase regulating ubiquinone biosynthesis (AarF/ABC1/UbiB family)
MTELPRKAFSRSARLAALPLGYAGRTAVGFGRRLGGAQADAVLTDVQQRTAEQLFRTLGELKGGAMKFGQTLSVLEAALPDELVAPYREHLTRLQDDAPPMPTQTVRDQLTTHLGPDWSDDLVWLDGGPTAAASIGQVHKGRWKDGRDVAVKVQYPGAGEALMGDLRQIARVARGVAPVFPGMDIKPLVAELQARAADELDYTLEAEAQRAFAEAFRDDPDYLIPDVVAVGGEAIVTEWLESPYSLAHVIREGTPEERDHYGELLARFLFVGPDRTGMLHADPHPGNFRPVPGPDGEPGRLGILDFGAVARLPQGQLPEAMGRLIRLAADADADPDALVAGLREEGFIKDRMQVDPQLVLDYLSPFIEPARVERFRFTREWMRAQFERLNNPRDPAFTMATKINLPSSYLLIHRTWLGGLGLLSQLEAEAPFRQILLEHLPGFATD